MVVFIHFNLKVVHEQRSDSTGWLWRDIEAAVSTSIYEPSREWTSVNTSKKHCYVPLVDKVEMQDCIFFHDQFPGSFSSSKYPGDIPPQSSRYATRIRHSFSRFHAFFNEMR